MRESRSFEGFKWHFSCSLATLQFGIPHLSAKVRDHFNRTMRSGVSSLPVRWTLLLRDFSLISHGRTPIVGLG